MNYNNEKVDNLIKLHLENEYLKRKNDSLIKYKDAYNLLQSRLLMSTRYISDMHLDNADIVFIYNILNGEDYYYGIGDEENYAKDIKS